MSAISKDLRDFKKDIHAAITDLKGDIRNDLKEELTTLEAIRVRGNTPGPKPGYHRGGGAHFRCGNMQRSNQRGPAKSAERTTLATRKSDRCGEQVQKKQH